MQMAKGKTNIDKVSKLLDLLEEHLEEENCRHSPEEFLKEYESYVDTK